MGRETVEIIVGEREDTKEFVVHKELLMNKVSFFKKLFDGGFLESSAVSATLPEDNPDAFEVFIEWVYCSTVKSLHSVGRSKHDQVDLAISTVVLAEKYMLPELGDRAMSFLAKIGEDLVPTMSQMSTLYNKTPFTSKAHLYAARTVAWALVKPETNGVSNASIHDACQDSDLLLDAIKEVRGTSGPSHKSAHDHSVCDYHNHPEMLQCPYKEYERTSNEHNECSDCDRSIKRGKHGRRGRYI